MEVWLESLSMHLSVGMPLPSDLLFDIYHYRGISPCSSGSTTPEGIPSGHRSPALEPIREGKLAMQKINDVKTKSVENLRPIMKVSSVESLGDKKDVSKAMIKDVVGRNELYSKSCEDFAYNNLKIIETETNKFPNYENIDFLKNDSVFARDKETKEKEISLKTLGDKKQLNVDTRNENNANLTENNLKGTKFPVQLRKVPKNFTRNRFIKETPPTTDQLGKIRAETDAALEKPQKVSNLSLDNIKTTSPSKVTQKYVENKPTPETSSIKPEIPDVVSSTLKTPPTTPCCSTSKSSPSSTFSISRSIFKRTDDDSNAPKLARQAPIARGRQTPILGRKNPRENCDTLNATKPSASGSSSLVRNIIDSLNRKDRGKFELGNRTVYGRSSLKANGNPKIGTNKTLRSSSPEEFTAL